MPREGHNFLNPTITELSDFELENTSLYDISGLGDQAAGVSKSVFWILIRVVRIHCQ